MIPITLKPFPCPEKFVGYIITSYGSRIKLDIDYMDVSTDFFNGDLKETVYMEQPKHFKFYEL